MDSEYGNGITFIDIDETTFNTFAKVRIVKQGKVIKEVDNKTYNTYNLKEGESYDFTEFEDAELFYHTSKPIKETVERIKEILKRITLHGRKSRIVFLTARPDLDNKKRFLQAFEEQDIPMDRKELVYVDRTGNLKGGSTAEKKMYKITKYLEKGIYRRCRLFDDDKNNIQAFIELAKNIPKKIEEKVRKEFNLSENERPITFYAYHVNEYGTAKEVFQR